MPKILQIGPYRFFFYASDRSEPPHIHVERDSATAKFWLSTVELQRSKNFSPVELHTVYKLVEAHRNNFLQKWDAYFNA